jgi:hypothetical protein
MRFSRNSNPFREESAPKRTDLRRHGRVLCQEIRCSVGDVLDLSASGMRVRTRFRLPEGGESFVVTVDSPDGPIAILCRVRWHKRVGIFMREAGIEFFEVGPKSRAILNELARRAAYNETFRSVG